MYIAKEKNHIEQRNKSGNCAKFRMVLHNVPHCKRTVINRKLYLSHSFILTMLSIFVVEVRFSVEDSERLEKYNCFLWDFFHSRM